MALNEWCNDSPELSIHSSFVRRRRWLDLRTYSSTRIELSRHDKPSSRSYLIESWMEWQPWALGLHSSSVWNISKKDDQMTLRRPNVQRRIKANWVLIAAHAKSLRRSHCWSISVLPRIVLALRGCSPSNASKPFFLLDPKMPQPPLHTNPFW